MDYMKIGYNIESVTDTGHGSFIVTIDGVDYYTPDDMTNSVRIAIDTWVGEGGVIAAAPNPEAKEPTEDDVNAERDRRFNGGFTYEGVAYDSNADARENIAGAYADALTYRIENTAEDAANNLQWSVPGVDFEWIAHDNSKVPMTANQMIAFGKYAMTWKASHIFAARAIKDLPSIPANFADDEYWPR